FMDSLNAGHFAAGSSAPDYLIWHGLLRNGTSKTGVLLLQNLLNAAPQTAQAILEHYKRIDTFQQLSLWKRRRKPSTQSDANALISLDEIGKWVPVPASSESFSTGQLDLELNLWGSWLASFTRLRPCGLITSSKMAKWFPTASTGKMPRNSSIYIRKHSVI
ncbi:MAG: hypothetical protein RI842_10795, partial [Schleiferiaceae bacterium]|nr:hypothetical protein [Schleiferiaceae bacterium]